MAAPGYYIIEMMLEMLVDALCGINITYVIIMILQYSTSQSTYAFHIWEWLENIVYFCGFMRCDSFLQIKKFPFNKSNILWWGKEGLKESFQIMYIKTPLRFVRQSL